MNVFLFIKCMFFLRIESICIFRARIVDVGLTICVAIFRSGHLWGCPRPRSLLLKFDLARDLVFVVILFSFHFVLLESPIIVSSRTLTIVFRNWNVTYVSHTFSQLDHSGSLSRASSFYSRSFFFSIDSAITCNQCTFTCAYSKHRWYCPGIH